MAFLEELHARLAGTRQELLAVRGAKRCGRPSVHWCTPACSSHAKVTARSWPAVDEQEVVLRKGFQGADRFEAIEVRRSLDVPAAALAAQRRDQDDLDKLQDALDRRRAAAEAHDDNGFRAADIDFHRAVVDAAHNQLLAGIYGSLAATVYGSWTSRAGLDRAAYAGHDNHDELFEAIRDGSMQDAMLVAGAILDNQASDLENT